MAQPSAIGALRWPLAVGAVASTALFLTALLDFGDPLGSARDAVQLGAAARADTVRAAWAELRADSADIVEPLGGLAVVVPDEVPEFARRRAAGSGGGGAEVAQALARAARVARARGAIAKAEELARAAAERARSRDSRLFARIQLDRCRWAAARGAAEEVQARRAELFADGDRATRLAGTSVHLLAALVEPVDDGLAAAVLQADALALPAPVDRIEQVGDGVRIAWDPWWETLEARWAAAAPGDLGRGEELFHRGARRAEAVRQWFGGRIAVSTDRWELVRRRGLVLAMRRTMDGIRVLATSERALVARLQAVLGPMETNPYRVRFDPNVEPADRVRERELLQGDWLGFSIHRRDPYRMGRVEASRIAAVRVGLVILGVAILCAAMVATRALHRTRRLERTRSTFVASVTHDLRTPIQSILLMSETLERGRVALEANRARYFSTIRQEAQRLRRYVEDVLDSARMDRGEGARVDRQTVDAEEFFDSLERDLRQRAERDLASVEVIRHRLPEQLELDPDGTLRIVWNLFENALRYGRVDGKPAHVCVEIGEQGGVLSIVVHDRGPGVPARFARTIFEPFERAGAEDGGPTGTGLGLSIVRAIAQAHGGDAELLPSDQGARFEARLAMIGPNREGEPAA